jgi:hypothetical protein
MANYKLAVAGFFSFIIGIIMLFNLGVFLPRVTCRLNLHGWLIAPVLLYESITGILVLGGIIAFLINLSIGRKNAAISENVSKVLAGIVIIIFIGMILSGVFSLLDMSAGSTSGLGYYSGPCISSSGYQCQSTTYVSTTGNIFVTVGQDSNLTWETANIIFVPSGVNSSASGVPVMNFNGVAQGGDANTIANGLVSGQLQSVTLPASSHVALCTLASGAIWAQYTTAQNKTLQYVKLASVNLRSNQTYTPTSTIYTTSVTSSTTTVATTTSKSTTITSTTSTSTTSSTSSIFTTTIPNALIISNANTILSNYTIHLTSNVIKFEYQPYSYPYDNHTPVNATTYAQEINVPYTGYLVFNASSSSPNGLHSNISPICNWSILVTQETPMVQAPSAYSVTWQYNISQYNAVTETVCPLENTSYQIPIKNGTNYILITDISAANNLTIKVNLEYIGST